MWQECIGALVLTCMDTAGAGEPFTIHGKRGLYERRGELPDALASMPRMRLRGLAEQAVEDGWLGRDDDGNLTGPDD